MTDVEPNRPEHVVLFAMLRWYAYHRDFETPVDPDIVVVRKMARAEGPLHGYGVQGVRSYVDNLKDKGLVENVKYHGHSLGYRLTQEGMDVLKELGKPKQYDH